MKKFIVSTVILLLALFALPLSAYADTISLSGNVFVDSNENGVKDISEIGYEDVTIFLYSGPGFGVIETTQPAITDANGNYTLTNVDTTKENWLKVQVPTGYIGTNLGLIGWGQNIGTTINFGISPLPGFYTNFSDEFENENGTNLSEHNNIWDLHESAATPPIIQNNSLYAPGPGNPDPVTLPSIVLTNTCASMDVLLPPTGLLGIALRQSSNGQGQYTGYGTNFALNSFPNFYSINQFQNNLTFSNIFEATNPPKGVFSTSWHNYKICALGNTLTTYVDNTLLMPSTLVSAYSQGIVTLRFSAGTYIDNFTIKSDVPNNHKPILESIGNKSVNEGQLLQFTVNATDPDNDNLTYSVANLPSGATFNAQTRTFSWTPLFSQEGNFENVEFTVTDDGNPIELDTELITITVGNVNRAPEFDPVSQKEVLENVELNFSVHADDPDGNGITLSATNLPTGATFNTQNGSFSWIPSPSQSGIYIVTFNATDNGSPVETGSIDVAITVGDDPTPTEQAENLNTTVINYNLPTNTENSYLANLKKVGIFINEGKVQPAINQLNAFISKVESDYTAGTITATTRNNLINLAQALLSDLQ